MNQVFQQVCSESILCFVICTENNFEPLTEPTLVYIQILDFHSAHRTAIKLLIIPIKHHLRMYCNIQDICLLLIEAYGFYLYIFFLL